MASVTADLLVRILADTTQLSKASASAQQGMSRWKSAAKTAAIAIGGAFAVSKVVAFAKASVTAASEDAQAQMLLASTLKHVTGATDAQIASTETYIANLSQQTAIADDELRPALATLTRGFKDQAAAQRALNIATDVSAATGKSLATVTTAMAKAANGSTGGLGRLNVAVKNADGSAKSLDEIMGTLSNTFSGDAARAADTTAGRMRNAQIRFQEMQENIGNVLLPVIGELAPSLSKVADALAKMAPALPELAAGVLVLVAALRIWSAVQIGLDATLAANPIGLVVTAIAALVAIVVVIIRHFDQLKAAALVVFNFFKRTWPLLLPILLGPLGVAIVLIAKNFERIKSIVSAVIGWISRNWRTVVMIIGGPIAAAVILVTTAFSKIKAAATAVVSWVKSRFSDLVGFFRGLVHSVGAAIAGIVNAIKAPINAVIRGWNAISFTMPKISIPSWVPVIGGKGFGGFTISTPDIPQLAGGGVLTKPTVFVGGEAGTEIVAPERLLRAIVAEAGGPSYTLNLYTQRADGPEVARAFARMEILHTAAAR